VAEEARVARGRLGTGYTREKRTFGERLPTLLEQQARAGREPATMRALARELGINHAHLSRIVSGKTNPTLGLIMRTSEILGVGYFEVPEMREAAVVERVSRDPKMRDRLFTEVLNWKEDPEHPPPGTDEAKRYRATRGR
jgi:transcriptional regulator with XRE-family HTH domain